jgi:predicted small lipoprotein YifL
MGKRTRLCRYALIIIIGIFLLTVPACGKKGDPLLPQTPKANTSAQQPEKPAGEVPVK